MWYGRCMRNFCFICTSNHWSSFTIITSAEVNISQQVSLKATPSKCMPPPLQHSHTVTHMTLIFHPMILEIWTVRIQSVVGIVVPFGSKLQIHSAVHKLSSSQDFHERRCVTLTSDPITLEISSAIRTHTTNICGKSHIWCHNEVIIWAKFCHIQNYFASYISVAFKEPQSGELNVTLT